MKQRPGCVFVCGTDTQAFLSIIRSLGRRGIDVYVFWCPISSLALGSKYIKGALEIPGPSFNDSLWVSHLIAKIEELRCDVIFPTSDQYILALLKHEKEICDHCKIASAKYVVFSQACDKIYITCKAISLGIPCPRTKVIAGGTPCECVSEFKFPLIVKPRSSYTISSITKRGNVKRFNDLHSFKSFISQRNAGDKFLVQEYFSGFGRGVEFLSGNGEILFAFQHRRIHEPLFGGAGSYRKSENVNPEMYKNCQALMREIGYTGIGMVEFLCNEKDSTWVFVEFNPRAWGSLPLAVSAGADFPNYYYEYLIHITNSFPDNYKTGIYARNVVSDVIWFKNNFSVPANYTLHRKSALSIESEIKNILLFKEHFDEVTLDDLSVLSKMAWHGIAWIVTNFLWALNTVVILRRMLCILWRRKIKKTNDVLFFCMGNIIRSPFAQAYYKSKYNAKKSFSYGIYPIESRSSPNIAIKAAQHFCIDLTHHRSKRITNEIVNGKNVIFVFDKYNYFNIIRSCPYALLKTIPLGCWLDEKSIEISDPYRRMNMQTVIDTYSVIARAIDNIIVKTG